MTIKHIILLLSRIIFVGFVFTLHNNPVHAAYQLAGAKMMHYIDFLPQLTE